MKAAARIAMSLLLPLFLFCACAAKVETEETDAPLPVSTSKAVPVAVLLPDGQEAEPDCTVIKPTENVGDNLPAWKESLSHFTGLEKLDLSGSTLSADEFRELKESSGAEIIYSPVLNGKELDLHALSLDLRELNGEQVEDYLPWLPLMSELEAIELGEENGERNLSWEDILALERSAPAAEPHYSFTLFGKPFTLLDTTMDLNHRHMDDRGELVRRVVRCMPRLELLDMDYCLVESEDMAEIRDEFPNVKVVWRIFFGMQYTCRTDVEKILASWPAAGLINNWNCEELKYCTEVKYLDIGHNWELTDISFVAYMPNLEVCVMSYLQNLSDLTPFAGCSHLEYLELAQCNVSDVTPLKDLRELRHLSLLLNPVQDITCLYGLTDLERLYLGLKTPVPKEQTDEIQRLNPELEINLDTTDARGGRWRGWYEGSTLHKVDRYILLCEQFGYRYPWDYALKEADPLYYYHD